MKMTKLIYLAPAVLIAAGCASHDRQYSEYSEARFDDSLYPGYAGAATSASSQGTGSSQSFGTSGTSPFYSSDIFSTNPRDNSLVSQIRQSIQKDESLSTVAPRIQIGANSGVVTLMGSVNDEQQKESIEQIARQASGVTSVDNKLEVSSTASIFDSESRMNDAFSPTSRTNTSNRIYHEAGTNAQSNLDASGSLYTSANSLSNQVDSTSEQLSPTATRLDQSSSIYAGETNATSSAKSGVNVTVEGSSQSDRSLAQQVSQELRADASLASVLSQVSISVDDGKITLKGSVKSDEQKQQIESAIQRVTGVSSIDNQLQVGTDQSSPMNP